VVILSNLVLDITVDRLVTWNEIVPTRIEQALARRKAMPLSPAELSRCLPDLWRSEDAARNEIRRLLAETGVESLIDILIGKWPPLTLAAYRKPGQRGSATQAVIREDAGDPQSALEAVVGRVSSIPAQLKLLREYAAALDLKVAQDYVDVETAKQTGRAAFGEMVAYLKAHPAVRILLVEKTDRLYRNLKDWVTVDELEVEIHFPKEGVVLSGESRSSEKFMHGIKVLMAKNYIDNLSEDARKGMQEKAEQGIWPTKTPLGYRNITGTDGKKIIAADPAIAPLIGQMFGWYARGDISLKEAARKAHAAGLVYPRSGAKVPVSTIHTILRNRLYTGWFEWNGKLIQGRHEALVPVELWERVQGVLDASPRRPSAAGTTSLSQALSNARNAAARWSARSRSSAMCIIVAPATPISVRATLPSAGVIMCGRRGEKRSSRSSSAS